MKNWFAAIEAALLGMVALRIVSGLLEITAAAFMLKFNSVTKAVMINASLAVVGPVILVVTMSIGLVGMAERLSVSKLLLIGTGVLLIILGVRK